MKRLVAYLLLLVLGFPVSMWSQSQRTNPTEVQEKKQLEGEPAAQANSEVQQRGAGDRSGVRVTLRNKTEVKGYISQIAADTSQVFLSVLAGAQDPQTTATPAAETAAAKASPPAKQNSADLLRTFKTIYVQSKTPLAKPQMLAGELQKNANFDAWDLSITNDPTGDVLIEIDHQPGWFYYTYSMTHQSSGIVLATGRVDAWDGKYASAKIAKEIMKRVARLRSSPKQN
jgi:hypothetical protein